MQEGKKQGWSRNEEGQRRHSTLMRRGRPCRQPRREEEGGEGGGEAGREGGREVLGEEARRRACSRARAGHRTGVAFTASSVALEPWRGYRMWGRDPCGKRFFFK